MSVVKEPLQKVNIGLVANIDHYKLLAYYIR